MQIRWWRSGFFYILLLIIIVALVIALIPREGPEKVSLPEFTEIAKQGQIDTINQNGETVEGLADGQVTITTYFDGTTYELVNFLKDEGVVLGVEGEGIKFVVEPSGFDWGTIALTVILPIVLLGALFYFLFFRAARGAGTQAFNFSKSRARLTLDKRPDVTFADVAGTQISPEIPCTRGTHTQRSAPSRTTRNR